MPVVRTQHQVINEKALMLPKASTSEGDFAASLKLMVAKSSNNKVMVGESKTQPNLANTLIPLGEINNQTPTVSHLLKSRPDFAKECWQIISSPVNSDKDYGKMQAGTKVFYNPDNDQLSWGKYSKKTSPEKNLVPLQVAKVEERGGEQEVTSVKSQMLGIINAQTPTVSHLFKQNTNFDGNYWNIINSPINAQKNYRSLRPGTEVWLDPANDEIHFSNYSVAKRNTSGEEMVNLAVNSQKAPAKIHPQAPLNTPTSSVDLQKSLADAVKPYIGTPYEQIDCYGLLVRGLANQGIKYQGSGGIREQLETAAIQQGLPANSYLNGEGLVDQVGTRLYYKALNNVHNSQQKSEEIFSEMLPNLKKGHILSFSTPTKGHTGVISKKGDQWTYINSGLIDHQLPAGHVSKRVGEELLQAEIKNWCNLAASRKESLTVTMGRLDAAKLRSMTESKSKDLAAVLQL